MEPNKKKRVIDLTVIDQLIQSGVDAIALVEEPAIEINFLAFKKEKFVTPSAGESEGDFIGRCMSAIAGEFPDQDQRLAVCYSYWEGKFQEECPPATTDIALNLENRQNAIDTANYGPLNPNLPNEEYWQKKADMFGDTVEDAKKALCGNCSFFVVSPSIKECIASGIGSEVDPEKTIEAGELGYCEAFDFKCAAKRTCDAWVVGGPITMERESFESYSDYPEAAKNNASRALKYAEENGWGSCGTPVGKIRANQLAKGEPISEDTISRMASFARHKQNSDTPYGEGCGKLMWDAWGGTEGIEWASRKLEEIRKEKMQIDYPLFRTPEAASDYAENVLGCSGFHEHVIGNETYYMPCETHPEDMEIVVNAPAYIDQTGESNKKKKKWMKKLFSSLVNSKR